MRAAPRLAARLALIAPALLSMQGGSAIARVVVYPTDMASIHAAAADQAIAGPFSEPLTPEEPRIRLETPEAANHNVIVASVYCQAYKIENPVSVLLQDLLATANKADLPEASTPELTLRILSGSTLLRCMGKNELQTICKNRVRIAAEARFTQSDGSVATRPVIAVVEREGRVGGFCGNIARYTGIVTREAGIELIRQARAVTAG